MSPADPPTSPGPEPRLQVWAPHAARVCVELGAPGTKTRTLPMERADGGWWVWDAGEAAAYDPLDYAFRIDDAEPLPDPRSAWQPEGVHGPSRFFDAGAHQWRDAAWPGPCGGRGALGGVLYELHVGTFTPEGTLDPAVERLEHLVALGVDVVELMPLAAFPGRWNWGYDGVGPYAVHDLYGGPAALQRFVDACHERGLGVCLDVVYNHLGPVGNYLSRFGPYFTDAHPTPWGPAVNLDGSQSEPVRRWVIDNALRWFEDFHVDALRLDAVHELRDTSARHVLQQMSDEVAALAARLGRPLALIAESDLNDPLTVTPTVQGGFGMTAQWADDVHHGLHVALTGETQGYYADFAGRSVGAPGTGPLAVVAKTLTSVFLHDGGWSSFRGRAWGAPVDRSRVDGRRFVAYLQTHDQVGNRAVGDRISDLVTPGQQAIGAALYLLSAFTPMVFMGEEWAASTPFQFFTDFEDPQMQRLVSEGRRSEFAEHGWDKEDVPDPQEESTYRDSQLRWEELAQDDHARMLGWYRDLVALRRREPDLRDGRLDRVDVAFDEDDQWLVMTRGSVAVAANLADREQEVPLPAGAQEALLSWGAGALGGAGGGIRLGSHAVAVVRLQSAVTARS